MKNTIVTLRDNEEFVILDEMNYKKRKYVCAVPYDRATDDLNDDEYYILEVVVDGDKLAFNDISDVDAPEITAMMLNQIKQNA